MTSPDAFRDVDGQHGFWVRESLLQESKREEHASAKDA